MSGGDYNLRSDAQGHLNDSSSDQHPNVHKTELFPPGRLYGSYPETAFEEVIEANRRGTWTINAVIVHQVKSAQNHMMSGNATNQASSGIISELPVIRPPCGHNYRSTFHKELIGLLSCFLHVCFLHVFSTCVFYMCFLHVFSDMCFLHVLTCLSPQPKIRGQRSLVYDWPNNRPLSHH
jgi:hypothetical protein